MKDGPSPDDFRAKLFRDREHTGDWRVEKLCEDGESIDVAIFSGGGARQRAIRCNEPVRWAWSTWDRRRRETAERLVHNDYAHLVVRRLRRPREVSK